MQITASEDITFIQWIKPSISLLKMQKIQFIFAFCLWHVFCLLTFNYILHLRVTIQSKYKLLLDVRSAHLLATKTLIHPIEGHVRGQYPTTNQISCIL